MGLRNRALRYRDKGQELAKIDKVIGNFPGDPAQISKLKKYR